MMKHKLLLISVIALLGTLLASSNAPVAAAEFGTIPVERLLNRDGTLNLSEGGSGTIDLSGWQVALDSQRGPILTRQSGAAKAATNSSTIVGSPDLGGAPQPTTVWLALSHNGLSGPVYALAVSGSDVYVGGNFHATADGTVTNLNYIAKFNTTLNTWSALPHFGLNADVFALAVSGNDLYVGGEFTETGDCDVNPNYCVKDLNNIAKFSGGAWSALPHKGLTGYAPQVRALAFSGNDLYVGGRFTETGDCSLYPDTCVRDLNNIARFSGGAWSALPNKGLSDIVYALAFSGTDLYVGGGFAQTFDSAVTNLNSIAKFSGGAWSALPNNGLSSIVYALAFSGTDLYVGGGFAQTFDGAVTNLNHIAKFSGGAWSALPNNGLNGSTVNALAVRGSNVYVGGTFTQTFDGAVTMYGIATFSGGAWLAPPHDGLSGFGGQVFALAVIQRDVFVGGYFTRTADSAVINLNYIAKLTNDTDGDGIPDDWEKFGITIDADGVVSVGNTGNGVFIDLPAMGADPLHKDLFVHADWMASAGLKPAARDLQIISDAFENAPLPNPDGTTGVHLHIDLGSDSVMNPVTGATWGALSQSNSVPYQVTTGSTVGFVYNWTDVDNIKQLHFNPARRRAVFHYMCFCNGLGGLGSVSGLSRGFDPVPAHDFLVTLGLWPVVGGTSLQKAGTFMHELGHNLGLHHGGGDDVTLKPNFLSVMNYAFQVIGLLTPSGSHVLRNFNYSTRELPALDETVLFEVLGIRDPDRHLTFWQPIPAAFRRLVYPATDWNCDGVLTPGTVRVDINGDGAFTQLTGFNDWPAVRFGGGGQILELPLATTVNEPTYQQIRDAVPPELFDAETTAPIDVVSYSSANGSDPLAVTFNGSASTTPTGTITSWVWDFGDGAVGSGPTITHRYSAPGIYFVTLTVTNSNGDVNLVSLRHRVNLIPTTLLNISTRMGVLTDDKVLIGGFIVTGTEPKRVIIRGIGPSLPLGGVLVDPTLELHDANATLATNDNWKINDQTGQSQESEVRATGIPPSNDLESVIIATLPANNAGYTAILRGKNGGTGVGLVETYDIGSAANSKLADISTRGFVDAGDNVMIGGFIAGPANGSTAKVVMRAIGPSLQVPDALGDPTIELHDGNGTTIATNDNWKIDDQTGQSQEADIRATGIPPNDDRESALVKTLSPGPYTAIVRGKNNTTGVGLVEVYNIQ